MSSVKPNSPHRLGRPAPHGRGPSAGSVESGFRVGAGGQDLISAVRSELIPRLAARSLDPQHGGGALAPNGRLDDRRVSEFADLLVFDGSGAALRTARSFAAAGWTFAALSESLLAAAATRLGVLWERDERSFADVTVALSRLQCVMRHMALDAASEDDDAPGAGRTNDRSRPSASGRRILLAPVPGEQHTFGVGLVSETFRTAGWDVIEAWPNHIDGLVEIVERTSPAIVGLSAGVDGRQDDLALSIRTLKRLGDRAPAAVLAGGRLVSEAPRLAKDLGAHAGAATAAGALAAAESLIESVRAR